MPDEPKAPLDSLGGALDHFLGVCIEEGALVAEMLALLEELEWVDFDGCYKCPECKSNKPGYGEEMEQGHDPDCRLAAVLKKARGQ